MATTHWCNWLSRNNEFFKRKKWLFSFVDYFLITHCLRSWVILENPAIGFCHYALSTIEAGKQVFFFTPTHRWWSSLRIDGSWFSIDFIFLVCGYVFGCLHCYGGEARSVIRTIYLAGFNKTTIINKKNQIIRPNWWSIELESTSYYWYA